MDASDCKEMSEDFESLGSSSEDDEEISADDFAMELYSSSEMNEVDSLSSSFDMETVHEWDVTNDSRDVPTYQFSVSSLLPTVSSLLSINIQKRRNPFRERSWSLEECSVCCEVMLKDQDLKHLPCAHNFHSQCIMPWLAQNQTCPNCRKTT